MSSISIETNNEKKLRVEEYVRYVRIQEHIQQVLENANIKEMLRDAEGSIKDLTIDLVVRFSINR